MLYNYLHVTVLKLIPESHRLLARLQVTTSFLLLILCGESEGIKNRFSILIVPL